MTLAGRYEPLFDPIQLGPVTAPNRFYQVPHCSGMGNQLPQTLSGLRETKAEGGWGVVCTEYCSIHPSSDDSPLRYASLWDDDDVRSHAAMVENVHRHGALAGVQLWHGGSAASNLYTREPPLGVDNRPTERHDPVQSRAMDLATFARCAAGIVMRPFERSMRASTSSTSMRLTATCSRSSSRPTIDAPTPMEGSLENRVRLVRELLEETKEAVGDRCAVAIRLSTDAGMTDGEPDGAGAERDHRAARRSSRLVGRQHPRLQLRDGNLALRPGGGAREVRPARQAADREAGPSPSRYQAKCDGALRRRISSPASLSRNRARSSPLAGASGPAPRRGRVADWPTQ